MKTNFVFDIDGVMAIHMPMVKKKLSLPQINGLSYDFPELTESERERVFAFMKTNEYADNCEPDGSIFEFFMKAKNLGFGVSVLTSRSTEIADATIDWLERYFCCCDVVFEPQKSKYLMDLSDFTGESYVLIDDLPSNLVGLSGICSGIVYQRKGQEYSLEDQGFETTNPSLLKGLLQTFVDAVSLVGMMRG